MRRMWVAAAVGAILVLPLKAEAKGRPRAQDAFWTDAKAEALREDHSVLHQVAKRAMPSVVSITTTQVSAGSTEEQTGLGSGFIIHPDGYILTSAHVVEGAKEIRIKLLREDGFTEELKARLVGEDKATDFALLKVDVGRPLPVLPFGRSQDVDIADWVVVIGNPFGLGHSVSVGVVSFKGRTDVTPAGLDGYFDYIQTDAAINPGNSGGPVLDINGNVVAIANAVNVSGQGIGFAIPVEVAKSVIPSLVRDGKVNRGWVGITIEDVTPESARAFGIPLRHGVLISSVADDGPGKKAGLRPGDVIVGVDGKETLRSQALRWRVLNRGAGKRVKLDVDRKGKRLEVEVILGELPEIARAEPAASASDTGDGEGGGTGGSGSAAPEPRPEPATTRLGIGAQVGDVDKQSAWVAGLDGEYGALVTEVDPQGVGHAAGLMSGDIVLKVNKTPVVSREDLLGALDDVPSGGWVRVFVRRGNETHALTFRKP